MSILLLATGLCACPRKPPEKVIHIKLKNLSAHPVRLSYYFFIRRNYNLTPLVKRLEPKDSEEVEIGGSRGNPTFVLIAETLDDYRPKKWWKLVGNLSWDDGRTFEIQNRHVQPPGSESGGFPDPRRKSPGKNN